MSGAHRDEALRASVVPCSVATARGAVAIAESSSRRAGAVSISAARGAVAIAVASPALTESITHARGARA